MLVGLLHDVISFTYCCDISTSAGLCKYKTSTAEKPKLYEGERGGLPQTHCSWSFHHASSLIQSGLHLWYILHMGTSRLVHNNCILLLLQPSFQQLLVSTLNQCFKDKYKKVFYVARKHWVTHDLRLFRDLLTSSTVADGCTRHRCQDQGNVLGRGTKKNVYPCKPTCMRYSKCITAWEAVNRSWWTNNVTARWIVSRRKISSAHMYIRITAVLRPGPLL